MIFPYRIESVHVARISDGGCRLDIGKRFRWPGYVYRMTDALACRHAVPSIIQQTGSSQHRHACPMLTPLQTRPTALLEIGKKSRMVIALDLPTAAV